LTIIFIGSLVSLAALCQVSHYCRVCGHMRLTATQTHVPALVGNLPAVCTSYQRPPFFASYIYCVEDTYMSMELCLCSL
jgi:hypothetical protein